MAGGTTWEDETLGEWDPGKKTFFFLISQIKRFLFFR
jgi:hypothetical protein